MSEWITTSVVGADRSPEPYNQPDWMKANVVSHTKGVAERVMASMTAPYGAWSVSSLEVSRKWREVQIAYRGWYYKGTKKRCEEISAHRPNCAFVTTGNNRGMQQKSMLHYQRKSSHAIKPHEIVTPLGPDHPLERLLDHPNEWDSAGFPDIMYELELFLCLTGIAYLWVFPNERTGLPDEMIVVPSQWVYGPWVDKNSDAGISYYEIRPIIGSGVLRVPHDQIVVFKEKSPLNKLFGWSPAMACSEWIDSLESVMMARFMMMKNGSFPVGALELDENFHDPDDAMIDRITAKFLRKTQGEMRFGAPLILPPGAHYNALMISPTEMAFQQSADQLRDWILAILDVPKQLVSLQDAGSEIAMYGPLTQFACNVLRPRYNNLYGPVFTNQLARRYDSSIRFWWDDPSPESAEERRQTAMTLWKLGATYPNEIRSMFSLPPFAHGGNDPVVPSTYTIMPMNTGEDLSTFTDIMPKPQASSAGAVDAKLEEEEGNPHEIGKKPNVPAKLGKRLDVVESRLQGTENAMRRLSSTLLNGHAKHLFDVSED
jgi:hypothetical protein